MNREATPINAAWPSPSPVEALRERRRRLQRSWEGPALIAAGAAPARNFPHNEYPFRASSHFLYLVGQPLEHAVLHLNGGSATLFVPEPEPDASLWTGPVPSFDEIAEQTGIETKSLRDVPRFDAATAVLPTQDPHTNSKLAQWLGRDANAFRRPPDFEGWPAQDRRLAEALLAERLTCDAAAIDQIRQALAVTSAAHHAGLRVTRPDLREAAVRGAMEAAIIGAGMTVAYASIVTVHGEVLHNERHDHVARDGDLLLADVGAETPEGWASDVTRTWPVSRCFSKPQRELYDVVLGAQQAAIDSVAPGVEYRDVHRRACRSLIAGLVDLGVFRGEPDELWAEGAADYFFPHGVGHLLGLDVHDMEDLGDAAGYAPGRQRSAHGNERYLRLDRPLAAGMVVTIEPGFYWIDGLLEALRHSKLASATDFGQLERYRGVRGIRIEDDVLVTEHGAEVLSAGVPKSAADIEAQRA